MPEEDLCEFLERVESAYKKRLVRSWVRDPQGFPD